MTTHQLMTSETATHKHLADEVAGGQTNDESHHHPGSDGHDSLVHCSYALDLKVIRGDEGAYEEDTEDAQTPSAIRIRILWLEW